MKILVKKYLIINVLAVILEVPRSSRRPIRSYHENVSKPGVVMWLKVVAKWLDVVDKTAGIGDLQLQRFFHEAKQRENGCSAH